MLIKASKSPATDRLRWRGRLRLQPLPGHDARRTLHKVNTSLIESPEFRDESPENGTPYYYVVTSVDSDGDESVQSMEASATPGGGTLSISSSGSGGGCFIAAASGRLFAD